MASIVASVLATFQCVHDVKTTKHFFFSKFAVFHGMIQLQQHICQMELNYSPVFHKYFISSLVPIPLLLMEIYGFKKYIFKMYTKFKYNIFGKKTYLCHNAMYIVKNRIWTKVVKTKNIVIHEDRTYNWSQRLSTSDYPFKKKFQCCS